MEYSVYVPIFDAPGEPVTVSTWHKSAGQAVKQGEVIAEVDSDTATCEVICPVSGILDTIFIGEGKSSQVGAQIAIIVADRTSATSEFISSSNMPANNIKSPKTSELEGVFNESPLDIKDEDIAEQASEYTKSSEFSPQGNSIDSQEINDATAAFTSAEFNAQKVAQLEERIEEELAEQRIIQEEKDATAAFTSAEFNAQKVAELEERIEEELEEQRIIQEEKDATAAFTSAEFNAQKVAELEEKIEEALEEQRIIQEEKDATAAFTSSEFNAQKVAELEEKIEEELAEQRIIQEDKDALEAFTSTDFARQKVNDLEQQIEEQLENIAQETTKNLEKAIECEMAEEIAKEIKREENVLDGLVNELVNKKDEAMQSIKEVLEDVKAPLHEYYNDKKDLEIASRLSKIATDDKPATNPDFWNKIKSIITPNETVKSIGEVEKSFANRRRMAADTAIISTVVNEIDMTAIIEAARCFGDDFFDKHNLPLGFTAFILKIVSKTLKIFPMFNAYMTDESKIIYKKDYDIAIVTHGMDETPPPVIRGVDMKNIGELQKSVTILSERAKKGELTLEETSGATFTLINAGAHGSLLGSDAVAYPQIVSLTMHKVCQRPVVKDDKIVIRPMMYISMSFDHRISNSKSASMFVATVKKLSENLSWMALGI